MPKVSVIVNCLNGAKYLKECLDSIYNQTYKDWEIIFWDNCSTDESPKIAKSYDNKLKYFSSTKTIPLGEARNSALKKAQGDYTAFLDTDDIWMPEKLELQVPLFEKNNRTGIVFSDAVIKFESNELLNRNFFKKNKPLRGSIFSYTLHNYNSTICMPTVMISKKALYSQSTWFDSRFEIATDFDLFLRIAYSYECDYVDKPLAVYRVHDACSSKKFYHNHYKEIEMTLEKFVSTLPGFEFKHKNEIQKLVNDISFLKGRYFWSIGKPWEARKEFLKQFKNTKFILAYIATLFPYQTFMTLLNLFKTIQCRIINYKN